MASIQDEIFKSFAAVAGQPTSNTGGMLNPLADLVAQIGKMQAGGTAQVQTQARAQAAAGKSTASMVGSIASTVLKTGFGMAPLVGELLGLFGGGGSPAPAPLVKYAMPAAIHFEGAETAGGLSSGDYDQRGMARAYGAEAAGGGGTASTG